MSQRSYEQSTWHPLPHSPRLVGYGSAHDDRGCCLHPPPCLSSTAVAPYSRIVLPIVGPPLSLSCSAPPAASSLPRPADAALCPELSTIYGHWQRYIAHHVAALSLKSFPDSAQPGPAFRVTMAATGHEADEKCEHEGLRIALTLPLASLGLEERRQDFGLAPQESVCCCIDVGRSLSAGRPGIQFQYHVQVFACKAGATAEELQDRSSFPLACLLRHRLALLLDDYQPLFPHHPESVQPPPNSFTGCLQPLLHASIDAAAAFALSSHSAKHQLPLAPRSLLSLAAEALPMNPLLHVMRELQAGLRRAGHLCVVCGSELEWDTTQRMLYCCHANSYFDSCEKALLSSAAFTRRLVHAFCSGADGRRLELYVSLLTAAAQSGAGHCTSALPPSYIWQPDSLALGGWNSERLDSTTQLVSVLRRMPPVSHLDLRCERSMARQLDGLHCNLLPLLTWTILYYRCRLHTLPEHCLLLPGTAAPCIVAQYAISLLPQLTSRSLQRLQGLAAALRFGQLSLTTSALFFTAPLAVFHTVLAHGPLLSDVQFTELSRLSSHSWKHHKDPLEVVDWILAAAAAAAADNSSSGGSRMGWSLPLPVTQPSRPPFQLVAFVERIDAEQADRARAGLEEQDDDSEDAAEEDERRRARRDDQRRSSSPSASCRARAGRQPQQSSSVSRPPILWALRAVIVIRTVTDAGGRQNEDSERERADTAEDVEDGNENRCRDVERYGGAQRHQDRRGQSCSSSSSWTSEPD